ncbi:MAG: HPr(Ser) kinase/phosphatase [Verrucomicrobiota bacterium]|nr:HPr(Ser) kinase/phosphatase [Verrucomicrobiota bacterium]
MPKQVEYITVDDFYRSYAESLGIELVSGEGGLFRRIKEATVNRPGLALAGFFRYFADKRIQVIGSAESTYLKSLSASEQVKRIRSLFNRKIPCLIFARNLLPSKEIIKLSNEENFSLFRSTQVTMQLINKATLVLEEHFAPQTSEFASMIDIAGIGVLIRGKSGIGKSECVLALIERGYSFVADDVTYIRLRERKDLIATSPDITRNHIEVRGIGIINVASVFGVQSITIDKKVELVVTLIEWDEAQNVDRTGLDTSYYEILGQKVRHVEIPVRPGRDIARLVEVAALDSKLKSFGLDSAKDFNKRLIERMNSSK